MCNHSLVDGHLHGVQFLAMMLLLTFVYKFLFRYMLSFLLARQSLLKYSHFLAFYDFIYLSLCHALLSNFIIFSPQTLCAKGHYIPFLSLSHLSNFICILGLIQASNMQLTQIYISSLEYVNTALCI